MREPVRQPLAGELGPSWGRGRQSDRGSASPEPAIAGGPVHRRSGAPGWESVTGPCPAPTVLDRLLSALLAPWLTVAS